MILTVADLLRHAGVVLRSAGIDAPQREARSLLAHALDTSRDRISLMAQDAAPPDALLRLEMLLERRAEHRVPLSHLTGSREFYHHRFEVSGAVLDPRLDTEVLVEAALAMPFRQVLDLGTGSGCILLSLLAARDEAAGVGTDISPEALATADRNARNLGVSERCMLLRADWYTGVEGRFDLIVSNPPYIAAAEMADLAPELSHEPRLALTDEADGLTAYHRIVPGAPEYLNPGGRLLVEIGWKQADAVRSLFENVGFQDITVLQDIEGRDRVLCGKTSA